MVYDDDAMDDLFTCLKELWLRNPHMRFGQLVSNVSGKVDLYTIDDVEFHEQLYRVLDFGWKSNK